MFFAKAFVSFLFFHLFEWKKARFFRKSYTPMGSVLDPLSHPNPTTINSAMNKHLLGSKLPYNHCTMNMLKKGPKMFNFQLLFLHENFIVKSSNFEQSCFNWFWRNKLRNQGENFFWSIFLRSRLEIKGIHKYFH